MCRREGFGEGPPVYPPYLVLRKLYKTADNVWLFKPRIDSVVGVTYDLGGKEKAMLKQEALLKEFRYDEETGRLWANERRRGRKCSTPLGWIDKEGYVRVTYNGSTYYAHRIIWVMLYGKLPNGIIDHDNRNRADNRKANLLDRTHAQNARNTSSKHNTKQDGLPHNISWHNNRYRVRVRTPKGRIEVSFTILSLAIACRDKLLNEC
jgi:hypothetical protein